MKRQRGSKAAPDIAERRSCGPLTTLEFSALVQKYQGLVRRGYRLTGGDPFCAEAVGSYPAPIYLYEPNASIMKAGCFGLLALRYGLNALGRNSNLFVSNSLVDGFPGRQFVVTGCSTMNRQSLKALLAGIKSANVAVRNMPLSADELRKKLALKDGGDSYVFGTTAADGTHVILLCKRI